MLEVDDIQVNLEAKIHRVGSTNLYQPQTHVLTSQRRNDVRQCNKEAKGCDECLHLER